MYVEFMKNFLLAVSSKLMAVRLISASRAHCTLLTPRTCESYFPDMMYVEFMKNFLFADSCKYIAVGLISAS